MECIRHRTERGLRIWERFEEVVRRGDTSFRKSVYNETDRVEDETETAIEVGDRETRSQDQTRPDRNRVGSGPGSDQRPDRSEPSRTGPEQSRPTGPDRPIKTDRPNRSSRKEPTDRADRTDRPTDRPTRRYRPTK